MWQGGETGEAAPSRETLTRTRLSPSGTTGRPPGLTGVPAMTSWMRRTAAVALTLALCGGSLLAADVEKKATPAFGVLQSVAPDVAKAQALEWLKSAGKTDDASLKAFDAIWAADRPT